jgi:hypothetical protein
METKVSNKPKDNGNKFNLDREDLKDNLDLKAVSNKDNLESKVTDLDNLDLKVETKAKPDLKVTDLDNLESKVDKEDKVLEELILMQYKFDLFY